MRKNLLASGVLALAIIGGAGCLAPAFAQSASSTSSSPDMMMNGHGKSSSSGMMGHGGMMSCNESGHIDGRIAFLKTELKITEAQMDKWNAYVEAYRAHAEKMTQDCAAKKTKRGSSASMDPLPKRLDDMEQRMTEHLAALQTMKKAAIPLYDVLSAEQKKTADQLLPPHGSKRM